MKVVVGVLLVLVLSLLLAFPASCEEEQQQQQQAAAGGGAAVGCQSLRKPVERRQGQDDPEEAAHHWGGGAAGGSSPISYVLSEIKALQEEIQHTILHVERRSLVVAGVLCGLTVLVLAVGVLVVHSRDRAQDRVHYVAVQRAQSNVLSEFKRLRSENRLGRSGSKARLLKDYGGSSDTPGSDSETSQGKGSMPRNHSLPSYLGKGDSNASSSSRSAPSPLAAAIGVSREEGRESLVEDAKDALQSLKNACHFTLGRSDSDASLRELEGVTELPGNSSSSNNVEKMESLAGEGQGESGAWEDRRRQPGVDDKEEKPSFVLHSAETIGQLPRSSSKEKLHQH